MPSTYLHPMYKGQFQIGYVTKDLNRAQQFFTQNLGVPKFMIFEKPMVRNQQLYGKPINISVNLGFGQWGNCNIEIIQPLEGQSTYTEMLARYEWIGIHHIAVKTHDFEASIKAFEAQGFPIAQTGEIGSGTRFHYMDTRSAMGHYTEILFFDPDFEKTFDQIARGDF